MKMWNVEQSTDVPLNNDPHKQHPALFSLSQKVRDQTPAKWEAPVDSMFSPVQLWSSFHPSQMWVYTCLEELLLGQECHMARGKDNPRATAGAAGPSHTCWVCGLPDVNPPLTVAVGEVEVALGTGVAVLPGVVGFAVAAPGEVLAGAIGEVRFAVTACREGQASSSVTDRGLRLPTAGKPSRNPPERPPQCHQVQEDVTAKEFTLTVANVRRVDGVVGGSIVPWDAPLTINACGVMLKDSGLYRHQFLCLQE